MTAPAQQDSLEANKNLVRSHYEELVNRKNLHAADAQLSPAYRDHEAPAGTPPGPDAVKQWMRTLNVAFPDLRVRVEDLVAEGDRVAVRATWRGTHRGSFMGYEATGRAVTFTGMVFWRVENGKIAERWSSGDREALLRQIAR